MKYDEADKLFLSKPKEYQEMIDELAAMCVKAFPKADRLLLAFGRGEIDSEECKRQIVELYPKLAGLFNHDKTPRVK